MIFFGKLASCTVKRMQRVVLCFVIIAKTVKSVFPASASNNMCVLRGEISVVTSKRGLFCGEGGGETCSAIITIVFKTHRNI